MKRGDVVLVGACLSLFALSAYGQVTATNDDEPCTCAPMILYRQFDIDRWERGYVLCLESPVNGVVESALRQVTLMKLAQPDAACSAITKKVDYLVLWGNTPAIRYKATLARHVFENPRLFSHEAMQEYRIDEEVFSAIARRLALSYLTPQP